MREGASAWDPEEGTTGLLGPVMCLRTLRPRVTSQPLPGLLSLETADKASVTGWC